MATSLIRFFHFKGLLLVILFAAIIRLWHLGQVPISPDWDEAALGYNAYSILTTGKDEYGTFLPRVLRSFDDYKPPLYAYFAIPSVAIFGLDTWSVRLPSAIMGILAVIGVYFLVRELFPDHKKQTLHIRNLAIDLPFVSALLLAISPWHIQFSRIAFEANIGVTIHIWAITLFIIGIRKTLYLYISAFLFALGLYAYHSERIFLPIIALTVAILFRKQLLKTKKTTIIACAVGLLTVAPLITTVLDPVALTRLRGTSSLSDQTGLLMRSTQKLADDAKASNMSGVLFDNRRIVYVQKLLEGYTSHFSLKWLFLTGDNDRHHAPDMGLLYWWEIPFLCIGLFLIWRRDGATSKLLLTWFFVAPLAASPTSETPHAIRTLVFLPTFQIFIAVGLLEALLYIQQCMNKKKAIRYVWSGATLLYALFMLFNISLYFHMYFAHLNREFSEFWQYGYKQAVEYAQTHKNNYKKIVVSTTLEQPHMFFLFYTKYDPKKYLSEGGTQSGGFAEYRNKFDIYEFRSIDWSNELHDGSILYIGSPKDMPSNDLGSIFYLNGKEAMRISH